MLFMTDFQNKHPLRLKSRTEVLLGTNTDGRREAVNFRVVTCLR